MKRWWAGRRGTVTTAEIDLRVGGSRRYVLMTNEGFEVGFHGEYREVVPHERFVCTEIFEGMPEEGPPAAPTINTYTFTEREGRTTLELLTVCDSKETRDAIVESGMEVGVQEGYDLVEEIAVELAG